MKVCQPAEGCHIDGDLCTKDADCCGAAGSGLPGDGNVVCEIQAGFSVGICRNPTGCNPEGNVCHYKNYACAISSARNDCCGAPGNSGACQLDKLGVPRCHAVGACVTAGAACAFDADCCNGGHCVPGPDGKLACQTACSPTGGACTVAADCCAGLPCIVAQGATNGVCGTVPPPPGPPPAGPPPPACALYGQACAQDQRLLQQRPVHDGRRGPVHRRSDRLHVRGAADSMRGRGYEVRGSTCVGGIDDGLTHCAGLDRVRGRVRVRRGMREQ